MFRFLCAPALFLALIAPAEALTLDCAISSSRSNRSWVTPRYIIKVDEAGTSAEVLDSQSKHYNGGPIAAKISENSDKKLAAVWDMKVRSSTGQVTIMKYRAAYLKPSAKVIIRATPAGFRNSFEGRGSCKTVK